MPHTSNATARPQAPSARARLLITVALALVVGIALTASAIGAAAGAPATSSPVTAPGLAPPTAPAGADDNRPVADPSGAAATGVRAGRDAIGAYAFPGALALVIVVFLLVQHWLDRGDPKVRDAPLDRFDDLVLFVDETIDLDQPPHGSRPLEPSAARADRSPSGRGGR